ncbi:hypothetical protein G7046_g487 [Stylonectria norvegica]|nr:hypothetical protein G7046_g487 [Stylonectria norvegica]
METAVPQSITDQDDSRFMSGSNIKSPMVEAVEMESVVNSANSTSRGNTFSTVPFGLVHPDEVLMRKLRTDTSSDRVDLVAGVYRNDAGLYHEFEVIRKAKQVLARMDLGHDYIPIFGIPSFREEAQKLGFGAENDRLQGGQVASLQTIAGCGANRIGAAFLKHHFPESFSLQQPSGNAAKVYIGTPGWRNHIPLFNHAGFDIVTYRHYDPLTRLVDFSAMTDVIRSAPVRSIFVLQTCCHNPTGADLTHEQWRSVAYEMEARQHFPFFDHSYAGFGSSAGDCGETDAWPIRYFVNLGFDMIVAQTFSKCMGLYGERLGCLHIVCQTEDIATRALDQARCLVRWEYSSPPAFAARLASIILTDEGLRESWRGELAAAAARIRTSRVELYHLLTTSYRTPGKWECILNGTGMFSFLPLSPEHIEMLSSKFHIWMPDNGRMNMAGLNDQNIDRVASSINAVVQEMQLFKFVTIEGGGERLSKPTSSIRSHAIRASLRGCTRKGSKARRGREDPLLARGRGTTSVSCMEPYNDESRPSFEHGVGRWTESSEFTGNIERTPSQSLPEIGAENLPHFPTYPLKPLAASSVDPFNSLPVPANAEVNYLIKYCIPHTSKVTEKHRANESLLEVLIKFDLSLSVVDRPKAWFSYALQNASVIHSTLAMAACLWSFDSPGLEPSVYVEGIRQKCEAVHAIRAGLITAASARDDEIAFLLTTMATLVIVEVCDSNFEAAKLHLQGVHHLIISRGDHDCFKNEFIPRKSINVANTHLAAALGRKPMLLPFETGDMLATSIEQLAQHPLSGYFPSNVNFSFQAKIFPQIRQLLLARDSSTISSESQRVTLNLVDDSILRHLYETDADQRSLAGISRALIHAAHVFMYVALRHVSSGSPVLREMCQRLQLAVKAVATEEPSAEDSSALMWIAFVGQLGIGLKAKSCLAAQWYLNLFRSTASECHCLGSRKDGIREILASFLWDEVYCLPLLDRLEYGEASNQRSSHQVMQPASVPNRQHV